MRVSQHALALGSAAALTFFLAPVWAADSPVTVGDGSIVIGHPAGDLGTWKVVSRTAIEHPLRGNSMAEVEATGPGATGATCAGRGRCVIEIKWSTGQAIRFTATAAGNKGARLEAQGVNFDDPAWQRSARQWRFSLPASATPTVTIRDGAGGAQPEILCQGKGCQVTIHYR